MSKRVNISLPDDLVLAMQPFKEEMNVSQLCAERLQQEVETLRIMREAKPGLREAVHRLRAERFNDDGRSRTKGYQAGVTWVLRDAPYAEIKWVTEVVAPRVEGGERACDIVAAERPVLHDQQTEPTEALADLRDLHVFWEGFLKAVLDLWAEIEDAVDGDDGHPPMSDKP